MKIAMITDLHFGIKNNNHFFIENQFNYLQSSFFPFILKNKIKNVFILGDIFDNKKTIDVFTLNKVISFFNWFEENEINVYVIEGNHDIYYTTTNVISSVFCLLEKFKYIHIIKDFEYFNFDGITIGFCSWLNEDKLNKFKKSNKSFHDWLLEEYSFKCNIKKIDVLCCHLEINDFEITPNQICDFGLSKNVFSDFDKVFSGHFHKKNTIGNITYIGSLFETSWNDYNIDKGFCIFDTKTSKLRFHKNKDRLFVKLFINDDNITTIDSYKNKIIKITLSLTDKDKDDYVISKLQSNNIDVELKVIEHESININEHDNLYDLIYKFIVDDTTIDDLQKSDILKTMTEIYESCDHD